MGRIRSMWQSGRAGKIALGVSAVVALLLVCCVVSVVLSLVNQAGQSLGIIPTSTITPIPSATPLPTDVPPTPTDAPTRTPKPTRTPAPTLVPSPTETVVPTDTPEPTVITNPKGVAPVAGDCPAHYRIKISKTGVAHDLESGSYSRTNPVHCYATMKDATDAGYTPAGD